MGRGLISINVVFNNSSNQALIQDIEIFEFIHSYFTYPLRSWKTQLPMIWRRNVAIFRGLRLTQHVQLPPASGSQNT